MGLKFNNVVLFILCAVLYTSTASAFWYSDEEAYDNSFDRIPTIVIDTKDGFKRVPSPSYRRPEWVSSSPNPYTQNWKKSTDGRYPPGQSPFNYDESLQSPLVGQEDYRDVYSYRSSPYHNFDEEEEDHLVGGGRTKYLKRSVSEAIEWARRQIHHPSQSWYRLCQSFVRQAYGVPGWANSAIIAWNKIPNGKKHIGGSPSSAPRGAALYYSGGQWGHVALASRTHALSNDYKRRGKIDYVPRSLPAWGNFKYLGWSMWTPYGEMRPYT